MACFTNKKRVKCIASQWHETTKGVSRDSKSRYTLHIISQPRIIVHQLTQYSTLLYYKILYPCEQVQCIDKKNFAIKIEREKLFSV